MSGQDWKSKIATLLTLAAGRRESSPEEAKSMEEKAAYLMNKMGIEESELRMKTKSDERPTVEVFRKFPPYADSKLELLITVTHCLGGKIVWFEHSDEMHVFAFAGDLERIKMMYFSLLAQMHIEASSLTIPHDQSKRSYTTAWLKGFAYGVKKRMQRAYGKANSEANALVLYDRESKVRDEVSRTFKDLKPGKMTDPRNGQGFNDGVQSGLRADVGQDRFGKGPARRALGE